MLLGIVLDGQHQHLSAMAPFLTGAEFWALDAFLVLYDVVLLSDTVQWLQHLMDSLFVSMGLTISNDKTQVGFSMGLAFRAAGLCRICSAAVLVFQAPWASFP